MSRTYQIDSDDLPDMREHPRLHEHIRKVKGDLENAKRDARRWKVISIILFFVGIGAGWLLSILL